MNTNDRNQNRNQGSQGNQSTVTGQNQQNAQGRRRESAQGQSRNPSGDANSMSSRGGGQDAGSERSSERDSSWRDR